MNRPRTHIFELAELGPLIAITDAVFLEVLAKRGKIAELVGEFKDSTDKPDLKPKIRKKIEQDRLNSASEYATKIGVDPDFARAMVVHAIAESCRIQIMQSDEHRVAKMLEWIDEDVVKWRAHLKENLIKLTELVAPIYETVLYGSGASVATSMYVDYEWDQIRHEIENLRPRNALNTALDLGCATGRLTRKLSMYFKKVIGYDLSVHMLDIAKAALSLEGQGEIMYSQVDIEEGMKDIPSESVDLVIMSVGTASDMYDFRRVLASITRVLAPHGRFLLSFYNKSALMYHLFVPWPLSLQGRVNVEKKFLEVTVGGQTFPVFAHLYDTGQVKQLLKKSGLEVSRVLTYPTLGSILPNPVMNQKLGSQRENEVVASLKVIDQKLSSEAMGAYIIVTGNKPGPLTKK